MSKHDGSESGGWAALSASLISQGGIIIFGILMIPFMAIGLLLHKTVVQAHALSAAGFWPFTWLVDGGVLPSPDPIGLGFGVVLLIIFPIMIVLGGWIFGFAYWLVGAGILLAQFPLELTPYPNLNTVGLPLLLGVTQLILVLRYAPGSAIIPLVLGVLAGGLTALVTWVLPVAFMLLTWPYTFVVWLFTSGP
jgi:hypothetical protein